MKSFILIFLTSIVLSCLVYAQVFIPDAWAMGPAPNSGQGSSPLWGLIPIILIIVLVYFLIIKPLQRRAKRQMLVDTINGSGSNTSLLRPKVPLGCKVLGWFLIIVSVYSIYDHWTKPGAALIDISLAVGFFGIAIFAFAMLAGHRLGLAILSFILIIGGISIVYTTVTIVPRGAPARLPLFILCLLDLLATFYLLSQWKLFGQIAEFNKMQKNKEK